MSFGVKKNPPTLIEWEGVLHKELLESFQL